MHFVTSRGNYMHYTRCKACHNYNNLFSTIVDRPKREKVAFGRWKLPDINAVYNAHWRLSGRNKRSQLCHDGHQGNLTNVRALATHVGPSDDHGSFAIPLKTGKAIRWISVQDYNKDSKRNDWLLADCLSVRAKERGSTKVISIV